MSAASEPLLELRHVSKRFAARRSLFGRVVESVQAVTDVSLTICRGESLGLVGESGCGKSTLGRTALRLQQPSSGQIFFDGQDITTLHPRHLRALRRRMQVIFQDPYSSLNPRMSILEILAEPFVVHRMGTAKERESWVRQLLTQVGLDDHLLDYYPSEFSGGQRQRIGIARSIALGPELIVADEPVSALDVSVQSQILSLLIELKRRLNLSYLFIAHDLAVVEYIADRIAVMYLGRIVELARVEDLYARRLHPYTQALIAAIPIPVYDPEKRKQPIKVLEGDLPSPLHPPSGCAFHPRCPFATERCRQEVPQMRDLGTPNASHWVACHYA